MTYAKSDFTPATTSGTVENTSVLTVASADKFSLCREYERMVNSDDLNTQDIKTLQMKYPVVSRKCIRRWRTGIKPTGWKTYSVSVDPECSYANMQLMIDRHGVSDHTVRAAIEASWPVLWEVAPTEEKSDDYYYPAPRRKPSSISAELQRWKR